jgi:transitional endoplasmic reticulum ATPase
MNTSKVQQEIIEVKPSNELDSKTEAKRLEAERLEDLISIAKRDGVDKAITEMNSRIKREEQLIDIDYTIKCFQKEGAYALSIAVEKILGRFDMSPSGASEDPPQLINITLPSGKEVKAPWGRVALPGFDNDCYIELDYDWGDAEMTVEGRIRQRYQSDLDKIVKEIRNILANESIYLGQAIELDFDENNQVDEPEFMDLTTIDEEKILFSKEINDGLVPILARIKDTDRCRKEGLDIKLGVLMEGPYGTGKTLTAFWLGKIAREYGWTFIYLKNCKNAAKALKIAENYARNNNGVILFTEDIDQVIRGKRDQSIQNIVNTLDGGDTKNLPIISIFTTNHIEVIEPTFLRGKRIGSLIQFGVLDMDTAKQFIDKLVVDNKGKSLMVKGDHTEAHKALCGIVPAFASEVIDKAKAYMINRGDKKIKTEDIVSAAVSYKKQIEFAQCRLLDANQDELENAVKVIGKRFGNELFQLEGRSPNDRRVLENIAEVFNLIQKNGITKNKS